MKSHKTVTGDIMVSTKNKDNDAQNTTDKKRGKAGYHRIGFEIEESLYLRAKKFNEQSDRPLKFDRIFSKALTVALDAAEKEGQA